MLILSVLDGEPTPRNTPGGAFGEISDRAPDAGLRISTESPRILFEISSFFMSFGGFRGPRPFFSCVLSLFFLELSKSFSGDLKIFLRAFEELLKSFQGDFEELSNSFSRNLKIFLRAFEELLKSFQGDFKELPKSFQGAFGELPRSI